MTDMAYIAFVLSPEPASARCSASVGHFWRAHATYFPEDLGLGEPLNMLTRDDYIVEKYVGEAEWDDAGYWDRDSLRNLDLLHRLRRRSARLIAGASPSGASAHCWSRRPARD